MNGFGHSYSSILRRGGSFLSEEGSASTVGFLETLKNTIDENLKHHQPKACPLTKQEILELGTIQHEREVEEECTSYGLRVATIHHNTATPILYELALKTEKDSFMTSTGALCVSSGNKTGRSPGDKRIVKHGLTDDRIWWGKVNIEIPEKSYLVNRERAIDYLNTQERLFVIDAYAGWDPQYRIPIRILTNHAYHALFMKNMLVPVDRKDRATFHPKFVIYNAGAFPANRFVDGVSSQTLVAINFSKGEMIILGTLYAGEMKKGILTLMMYEMPRRNVLPLHSSCNVGRDGDVTLFFGLSGTGKTTLSADLNRELIGDDEHVWTDKGIFNVEGGCYAKCKNLSAQDEPEIFNAIKFGSVLENVVLSSSSRVSDFNDVSITENTRCAYPLDFIPNARIPATIETHPRNIILLTCDAFGVLPPVSKLTVAQTRYHFISGYTSKMAGTEMGIIEPTATFSSCYGAPFLVFHPMVYAALLGDKLIEHDADAWLINTGWVCGKMGSPYSQRCKLTYTRKMVDAIHDGTLRKANFEKTPIFNFEIPTHLEGVPPDILNPKKSWSVVNSAGPEMGEKEHMKQLRNLAELFEENFKKYAKECTQEVVDAGPHL